MYSGMHIETAKYDFFTFIALITLCDYFTVVKLQISLFLLHFVVLIVSARYFQFENFSIIFIYFVIQFIQEQLLTS